jgi:hypothetical protein
MHSVVVVVGGVVVVMVDVEVGAAAAGVVMAVLGVVGAGAAGTGVATCTGAEPAAGSETRRPVLSANDGGVVDVVDVVAAGALSGAGAAEVDGTPEGTVVTVVPVWSASARSRGPDPPGPIRSNTARSRPTAPSPASMPRRCDRAGGALSPGVKAA